MCQTAFGTVTDSNATCALSPGGSCAISGVVPTNTCVAGDSSCNDAKLMSSSVAITLAGCGMSCGADNKAAAGPNAPSCAVRAPSFALPAIAGGNCAFTS